MLSPDEEYERAVFADTDFGGEVVSGCHFLECTFNRSTFSENKLRKCRFTDSEFRYL